MNEIERSLGGGKPAVSESRTPQPQRSTRAGKAGPKKLIAQITILGRGASGTGQKFVKLRVDGPRASQEALLRTDNLGSKKDAFDDLNQRTDANILTAGTRTALLNRLETEPSTGDDFTVITKTGMADNGFYLPDLIIPSPGDAVEVYFSDLPEDVRAKYSISGTLKGWQKLAKYASGNSRMTFAFALNFVGPIAGIMPIEFVSGQLVGEGGSGKTAIGVAASSIWGWDPDSNTADKVGFGDTWNNTLNKLEQVFAGYNHTALFLDETRSAENKDGKRAQTILDTMVKVERSAGKGRLNEKGPKRSWYAPLLSTSNVSVMELLRAAGLDFDAGYIDRLPDIPLPKGGFGAFETLHDFRDMAEFSVELKRRAAKHHGHPGREYVRGLLELVEVDREKTIEWIEKRRRHYLSRAQKTIKDPRRDLTRIHGKFATIYAAGRLAPDPEGTSRCDPRV